eukprot:1142983-Pelagomonas_calceolata.AAC.5
MRAIAMPSGTYPKQAEQPNRLARSQTLFLCNLTAKQTTKDSWATNTSTSTFDGKGASQMQKEEKKWRQRKNSPYIDAGDAFAQRTVSPLHHDN